MVWFIFISYFSQVLHIDRLVVDLLVGIKVFNVLLGRVARRLVSRSICVLADLPEIGTNI